MRTNVPTASTPIAFPCPEGTARIVAEFTDRLLGLARSRLNRSIRSKVDPEDVLQSVFRSFFTRWRDGELQVTDRESLWGLLALITRRKCSRNAQHYAGACRDVGRETTLPDASACSVRWSSCGTAPDPVEAATLAETLHRLKDGLDTFDWEVVMLHLRGFTSAEVAYRMGCSTRTVRRTIGRARDRLSECLPKHLSRNP